MVKVGEMGDGYGPIFRVKWVVLRRNDEELRYNGREA